MIDFDTSSFSAENTIPARVLQLRAQIAAGQSKEVLGDIEGEDEVPDFAAVKALAQYHIGSTIEAIKEVEYLTTTSSDNMTVQILGGTVLQAAGKSEEALALLTKHLGSLEACVTYTDVFVRDDRCINMASPFRVALIVQIHLQQNRTDLALKEVQAARKWAQDSLLVNIAESWVGLRLVFPVHYPCALQLYSQFYHREVRSTNKLSTSLKKCPSVKQLRKFIWAGFRRQRQLCNKLSSGILKTLRRYPIPLF